MVSAIKIDGRRLHELAREGHRDRAAGPPRARRPLRHQLAHRRRAVYRRRETYRPPVVDCSSGTYIRSLAADLGRALGGGAHLRALRRTRVGRFGIDEACARSTRSGAADDRRHARYADFVAVDERWSRSCRTGACWPRELGVGPVTGPWACGVGDWRTARRLCVTWPGTGQTHGGAGTVVTLARPAERDSSRGAR